MDIEKLKLKSIFEQAVVKAMLQTRKLIVHFGDVKKLLPNGVDLDWCSLREYVVYDFIYEEEWESFSDYTLITLPELKKKIVQFFPYNVLEYFAKTLNTFDTDVLTHYLYLNKGWNDVLGWLEMHDNLELLLAEHITCENGTEYLQVSDPKTGEWIATILLYDSHFNDFVNYKINRQYPKCEYEYLQRSE